MLQITVNVWNQIAYRYVTSASHRWIGLPVVQFVHEESVLKLESQRRLQANIYYYKPMRDNIVKSESQTPLSQKAVFLRGMNF